MEGILNEIVNFVLLFLQDPVSTSKYLIHNYCLSFTWDPIAFTNTKAPVPASQSEVCSL